MPNKYDMKLTELKTAYLIVKDDVKALKLLNDSILDEVIEVPEEYYKKYIALYIEVGENIRKWNNYDGRS